MKRREFIKRAILATSVTVLPVALFASGNHRFSGTATSAASPEQMTLEEMRELVERMKPDFVPVEYYGIVHPRNLNGMIGRYEGFRMVAQTMIPAWT